MLSATDAQQYLPRPQLQKKLVASNALNSDIIQAIEKEFNTAVAQSKKIAPYFKATTRTETARKIWDFLKHQIKYEKDSDGAQMVRLPSRFVHDKKGDCKSFALFAASVLSNLKMPVAFRYASYTNSTIPSHIYTITKDEHGKEIIIDGVWKRFNSEKKPVHKFDHVMNVYTLSGTETQDIGKIRLKKFLKKLKIGKAFKKIGLALPRRAFRTLVAINAGGLASKLARAYAKNPGAIESKWKKLGGSKGALAQSVGKGSKRKRIFGLDENTIGAAPVAGVAAILAAAAPIIAAIVPLLKSMGVDNNAPAGEGTLDKVESAAQKAASMAAEVTGGASPAYEDPTSPNTATPYDAEANKPDAPGFTLSAPMLIGAAAVIFLITRKK